MPRTAKSNFRNFVYNLILSVDYAPQLNKVAAKSSYLMRFLWASSAPPYRIHIRLQAALSRLRAIFALRPLKGL